MGEKPLLSFLCFLKWGLLVFVYFRGIIFCVDMGYEGFYGALDHLIEDMTF